MAHEAYHWHKHRVYATVQSINSNKQVVAHRCPTAPRGNKINANQTPEDWMEWQANAVAPRILMPRAQTEIKVKEILRKHGYIEQTEDSLQVLQAVVDELSEYYLVSKQAAKIRLLNFGYREAAEVYNYDTPKNETHTENTPKAV
jgi:Zn-dependent peptidase ImmA (M78 family)